MRLVQWNPLGVSLRSLLNPVTQESLQESFEVYVPADVIGCKVEALPVCVEASWYVFVTVCVLCVSNVWNCLPERVSLVLNGRQRSLSDWSEVVWGHTVMTNEHVMIIVMIWFILRSCVNTFTLSFPPFCKIVDLFFVLYSFLWTTFTWHLDIKKSTNRKRMRVTKHNVKKYLRSEIQNHRTTFLFIKWTKTQCGWGVSQKSMSRNKNPNHLCTKIWVGQTKKRMCCVQTIDSQ